MSEPFPALFVGARDQPASLVELTDADLPRGEVMIDVAWSSLNYKDALAVTATGAVVRQFPMVCGTDLAGTVAASTDPALVPGTPVIITGQGLGETHFGGYAARARVPASWCVPLPERLSARQAMALGTAGLTAMLSFLALERLGCGPDELEGLPLLVTGAAGGVGSLALLIGARLGYSVVASTGRPEEAPYLECLGASAVIDRHDLSDAPVRALASARFGAAVDVVGGATLANVISQLRSGGAVAASGLVGGQDIPVTVHPFILRGVTLAGINAVAITDDLRHRAWSRLVDAVPVDVLENLTEEIPLAAVPEVASTMLAGRVRGRTVVSTTRR